MNNYCIELEAGKDYLSVLWVSNSIWLSVHFSLKNMPGSRKIIFFPWNNFDSNLLQTESSRQWQIWMQISSAPCKILLTSLENSPRKKGTVSSQMPEGEGVGFWEGLGHMGWKIMGTVYEEKGKNRHVLSSSHSQEPGAWDTVHLSLSFFLEK